jgi:hypothetical protein
MLGAWHGACSFVGNEWSFDESDDAVGNPALDVATEKGAELAWIYIKILVFDIRQRMPDVVDISNWAGARMKADGPNSAAPDDEDVCRYVRAARLR